MIIILFFKIFSLQLCRPLTQMVLPFPYLVLHSSLCTTTHCRYIIHYLESCCFNVKLNRQKLSRCPKVRKAACCWQQLLASGLSRFLCFEIEAGRLFNIPCHWLSRSWFLALILPLNFIARVACDGCIQFCTLNKRHRVRRGSGITRQIHMPYFLLLFFIVDQLG